MASIILGLYHPYCYQGNHFSNSISYCYPALQRTDTTEFLNDAGALLNNKFLSTLLNRGLLGLLCGT